MLYCKVNAFSTLKVSHQDVTSDAAFRYFFKGHFTNKKNKNKVVVGLRTIIIVYILSQADEYGFLVNLL